MKNIILTLILFTATTYTFERGFKLNKPSKQLENCSDPRYLKFILDNKLDKSLNGNITPSRARSIVKSYLNTLASSLAKRATEFK